MGINFRNNMNQSILQKWYIMENIVSQIQKVERLIPQTVKVLQCKNANFLNLNSSHKLDNGLAFMSTAFQPITYTPLSWNITSPAAFRWLQVTLQTVTCNKKTERLSPTYEKYRTIYKMLNHLFCAHQLHHMTK